MYTFLNKKKCQELVIYINWSVAGKCLFVFLPGTAIAASEYGFRFTDSVDAMHMWGRVMFGAGLAFLMEVSSSTGVLVFFSTIKGLHLTRSDFTNLILANIMNYNPNSHVATAFSYLVII